MDVYGTLLGSRLLVPSDITRLDPQHLSLHLMRRGVDRGQHPLPIFTAIQHGEFVLPRPSTDQKTLNDTPQRFLPWQFRQSRNCSMRRPEHWTSRKLKFWTKLKPTFPMSRLDFSGMNSRHMRLVVMRLEVAQFIYHKKLNIELTIFQPGSHLGRSAENSTTDAAWSGRSVLIRMLNVASWLM